VLEKVDATTVRAGKSRCNDFKTNVYGTSDEEASVG
jgi:hypothetical protein